MSKDEIFASDEAVKPFSFNENVAAVFDDMLYRSVPLYNEALKQQLKLAAYFYQPDTYIYDLGCSNGNFGISFLEAGKKEDFKMIAIDNSEPMLDIYHKRLSVRKNKERIRLLCEDISKTEIKDASVVIMNLTLQFLALKERDRLVSRIYKALKPGGIFLLTEKIINSKTCLSDIQQKFYYEFKAENGYSALEISRKREALENVLIPESLEDHQQRLKKAGFSMIEIYLKWFHFTSFLAIRKK